MAPFEQGDISRRSANVTLVQSYGELRQANEDLRQVTHAIAHDLQQPLFAAAGHVYALSRRLATQGGPPAELEKAADAIRLAQEMLAGLLEFARAGSAQPPEEVDLGALAREIADQVTQNRGLPADTVEIGPLPVLLAPPLQLRQIVQNLLDNALKFTGGDGPVRLAAELDRDQWVVSVTDHGLGIDPADAERIFDIFQRATDRHPGTGIGLAVCRRALQRMGGRIWVSPNPGGGSIFRFTIPERPRA
jgi:signal transduction histidine kinase